VCVHVLCRVDGGKLAGRHAFGFAEMPEANRHRIFLYGCNKLMTDRTSEKKDKLEKLNDMQEVFDLLMTGEWAKERQVGAVVVSCEVEALAQIQKLTIPEAQAALAQYDKGTRHKILGNAEVVELATHIKDARLKQSKLAVKSLDELIPSI